MGTPMSIGGLVSYFKAGTYMMLLGMLIAGTGISWLVEDHFKGEKETDKARSDIVKALGEHGMQKLNLVQEQVALIEPIILIGSGARPNESFQMTRLYILRSMGVIKYFVTW